MLHASHGVMAVETRQTQHDGGGEGGGGRATVRTYALVLTPKIIGSRKNKLRLSSGSCFAIKPSRMRATELRQNLTQNTK